MAMTVSEAAAKWGVNENTVRKWARAGRLNAKPLSEVMREKGLPAPKNESWIVFQDERPNPSIAPIVREKALPQEPLPETPKEQEPSISGWWK